MAFELNNIVKSDSLEKIIESEKTNLAGQNEKKIEMKFSNYLYSHK